MRIHVVDYGAGNVKSVFVALHRIGVEPVLTGDPGELLKADRIVLPGVGAAGHAMDSLRHRGLVEALERRVRRDAIPMLGICVGMQVLAERLYELGEHAGLGWLRGEVRSLGDLGVAAQRIPHTGWNDVAPVDEADVSLGRSPRERLYYFNHGFALNGDASSVMARVDYGLSLTAAVRFDTVWAVQFHPEKSQQNGLRMLTAFTDWRP